MKQAPEYFDGSWLSFYREFVEPNLPSVETMRQCHDWMTRYAERDDAVFPLRVVGSLSQRRRIATNSPIFLTNNGTHIAFADNSPAWMLHAWLMNGNITSFDQFSAKISLVPCHFHDIQRQLITSNKLGWYVAHIYPAKNGDTAWEIWSREEVKRRFFLTLHPCNLFFVPGKKNRKVGEDPNVIAFFANLYAERYGNIWKDFVKVIGGSPNSAEPEFGESRYVVDGYLTKQKTAPDSAISISRKEAQMGSSSTKSVRYEATRLLFKREVIEQLNWDDSFEIDIREVGLFRFTKREFYKVFSNVVKTPSYLDKGVYSYSSFPKRAKDYRVDR